MSRVEVVSTGFGVVPVTIVERGRGPLVLVMRGALPDKHQLEWLDPPDADTAFLHLPGMHSPLFGAPSIEAFASAFDEVIRRQFPGRPVILLGSSVSALVACAMEAPEIRARVLVEPFFTTLQLWPFRDWARQSYGREAEPVWRWLRTILGIGPDDAEERDYRSLLRSGAPILAVVGDRPLQPPRALAGFPSFCGTADRRLLREAGADIRKVAGGHNLPDEAPDAIQAAVADALSAYAVAPR